MNMLEYFLITKNDYKAVYNLASEIWNSNYQEIISQKQINYMLNMMYSEESLKNDLNEKFIWEFIYYNKMLVGYLSYTIKEDNRVFLSKIYLKTKYQGLGLSKKILDRVKVFAKKNKCKAVYLTVNINNSKGIRAYKSNGFTIIKKQIVDIGNNYVMDDYVFEYSL